MQQQDVVKPSGTLGLVPAVEVKETIGEACFRGPHVEPEVSRSHQLFRKQGDPVRIGDLNGFVLALRQDPHVCASALLKCHVDRTQGR